MPQDEFNLNIAQIVRRFILILLSIAVISLVTQVIVQAALFQQVDDARVINIAGRQRMLSQRVAKAALALEGNPAATETQFWVDELQETLILWQTSHDALQNGNAELGVAGNNSAAVLTLYAQIETNFQQMGVAATCLIAIERNTSTDECPDATTRYVATILENEADFLVGMNEIVFQYDREATAKLMTTRVLQGALFFGLLVVLIAQAIWVVRPVVQQQQQLEQDVEEFKSIEQNLPQFVWRQTLMGQIVYVSEVVTKILGYSVASMTGKTTHSFYHDEDIAAILEAEKRVQATKLPQTLQHRLKNSNGDWIWFETVLFLSQSNDKTTNEITCVSRMFSQT